MYEMPFGSEWKTCGGELYIKAGHPPMLLRQAIYEGASWKDHSWALFNAPKPEDVEIVTLSAEIKTKIVEELNVRRAKTLLGAYFDPKHPSAFGVVPPAAYLSTVEYSEDVARSAERYIQHFRFEHYALRAFYPHNPLGENLAMRTRTVHGDGTVSLSEPESSIFNIEEFVSTVFQRWFERELKYYRHFEPYEKSTLEALCDVKFKESIRNNDSLSEEDKKYELEYGVQFGHAAAVMARDMHSVGCALTRRIRKKSNDEHEKNLLDEYRFQYIFACRFGGGQPGSGEILYDLDENILQVHGIPKSLYNLPTD